jgi:hypothetical protein
VHVLASFDLGESLLGLDNFCRGIGRRGLVLNDGVLRVAMRSLWSAAADALIS